jgi:hypothetical protein
MDSEVWLLVLLALGGTALGAGMAYSSYLWRSARADHRRQAEEVTRENSRKGG